MERHHNVLGSFRSAHAILLSHYQIYTNAYKKGSSESVHALRNSTGDSPGWVLSRIQSSICSWGRLLNSPMMPH